MGRQRLKTPYKDLVPPLATSEFEALKADIKANGVQVPVVVDEDDNVLDGHHRYKCDPNAPTVTLSGLTDLEKRAYVIKANVARRNLSPDQRRELRKAQQQLCRDLKADKKYTQKQLAVMLGVAQQTIVDWLTVRTNTGASTTSKPGAVSNPATDSRVKIDPRQKPVIAERVSSGESQAQVAADYGVSQRQISTICRQEEKLAAKEQADREAAEAAAEAVAETDESGVIHADFRSGCEAIPDSSVALIFTDPPYDRESLPLFASLAETADRVLVDGGSLITFCGQYVLDVAMKMLATRLKFFWICCCQHTGDVAQMREYGIKVKWKPMIWYVKGDFRRDRTTWIEDLVVSQQEKDQHEWQQSVIEASHFIKSLTTAGEMVLDPFCGGGTTAFAAKQLGRKWATFDTDPKAIASARRRINK